MRWYIFLRFREDGADEDEEDDNDCCDGGDNPGPTILPGAFQPIVKVTWSLGNRVFCDKL